MQISRLNQTLRGWFAYFRSASSAIHVDLDCMVRIRLRAMLAKRIGRRLFHIRVIADGKWTNAFFAARSFLKSSVCATRFQMEAFEEGVRDSGLGGVGIFSPRPDCGRDGSERIPYVCLFQESLCI